MGVPFQRWNISQEKLTICINLFNSKEVATTYPEKDAEAAKNVEAASVDTSEATIKNMEVKDFKGGLSTVGYYGLEGERNCGIN